MQINTPTLKYHSGGKVVGEYKAQTLASGKIYEYGIAEWLLNFKKK